MEMHHGNAQVQDTRHSGTYDADRIQYHGNPWRAMASQGWAQPEGFCPVTSADPKPMIIIIKVLKHWSSNFIRFN